MKFRTLFLIIFISILSSCQPLTTSNYHRDRTNEYESTPDDYDDGRGIMYYTSPQYKMDLNTDPSLRIERYNDLDYYSSGQYYRDQWDE